MAHLLMIESWVGASGKLLPPLLQSMGHSYTFVTRNPSHYQNPHSSEPHPVLRYAKEVIETDTNDLDALCNAVRRSRYDGVITVCDYYIETVRSVAKALGLTCPFSANVEKVRQKHLLRQAIDRARLPNVRYRLVKTWEEAKIAAADISYPVVFKPVDLASSAFVKLVRTEDELRLAFNELASFPLNFRKQPRNPSCLLEEYLEGDEVSVESVSYGGRTTVIGVTDKSVTGEPYFIENGHMFPANLAGGVQREVTKYVQDVLEAAGYGYGIGHTEVKLTKNGPRVIEVNPRIAGNYIVELIERVTGINLLRVFVQLALGQEPSLTRTDMTAKSAAIMFYVPRQGGKIEKITGEDRIKADSHVVRYKIEDCIGTTISQPVDNACYLGHLVAEDAEGLCARKYAEAALACMDVVFTEEEGNDGDGR